jgi:CheY-like chemotaxis protein
MMILTRHRSSVWGCINIDLQDEGFEVYSHNDPLDALSKFRPNFYDLLLVDINMQKMNGIDLSRQILN